ncbi:MAG: 3-isopropylmalate dehydratase large subunit [Spirochaetales bacterium]|nr:3-isopropylmalate dehydratase large subunit [Spirochaetales bacterium]
MKQTLYEKILCRKTGKDRLEPGEIVEIAPDRVMIHDFFTPFVINKFREMGFSRVVDPEKIVIVYDHLVPATFPDDVRHHRITEEFVKEQGITRIHRSDGVCHQLMHEQGYAAPGDIVLGTDSHTVTYGAMGVLATGIGYSEMAAVLGTGKIWLKMVPTVRVTIDGALPQWVTGKDIILNLIRDLRVDGATYRSVEFNGTAIEALSQDARFTLSNMAVEAGAKTGLIAVDDITRAYCADRGVGVLDGLFPDEDAGYERVILYKAEEFFPVVACPYNLDNVAPASELNNVKIDQVFLGSCTNGRLEDLEVAARIVKGKKTAPQTRFLVVPASREVYHQAIQKGYISALLEAGAQVGHPSCSLCAGRSGGIVENTDTVLATNNRNFHGRMGGENAKIYIASPAIAAATALKGYISNPEIQ